jgi:hypothetical protein
VLTCQHWGSKEEEYGNKDDLTRLGGDYMCKGPRVEVHMERPKTEKKPALPEVRVGRS